MNNEKATFCDAMKFSLTTSTNLAKSCILKNIEIKVKFYQKIMLLWKNAISNTFSMQSKNILLFKIANFKDTVHLNSC